MRFGVCCGSDRLESVKKFEIYSYVEPPLFVVNGMSEKDFKRFCAKVEKHGLTIEAFNCLFAGDAVLIADGRDLDAITAYLESALRRAGAAGAEIVVFGSGKARRIPDGMDRAEGCRRFVELLKIAGDIAAKNGVRIAIEPLNSDETNLCNTVAETLEICRRVNHPSVGVLADFYHVFRSGESLDAIENAGELLFHTHIARANVDRGMPTTDEDVAACEAWAAALKKCGYRGRLSLEGRFSSDFEGDIDKVRRALALFE